MLTPTVVRWVFLHPALGHSLVPKFACNTIKAGKVTL